MVISLSDSPFPPPFPVQGFDSENVRVVTVREDEHFSFLLIHLKIAQRQILPGAVQPYTHTGMSKEFFCAATGTIFFYWGLHMRRSCFNC